MEIQREREQYILSHTEDLDAEDADILRLFNQNATKCLAQLPSLDAVTSGQEIPVEFD